MSNTYNIQSTGADRLLRDGWRALAFQAWWQNRPLDGLLYLLEAQCPGTLLEFEEAQARRRNGQ